MIKHGKHGTKLYITWKHMKSRCYNKNDKDYYNYGEIGITVCDEWRNNFQAFYDWSINNGYQDDLTIDRINNNGNYEPINCRWSDRKTQSRSRKYNNYYTIDGVTHCLSEWCEILNLNYRMVYMRLRRGWTIEKALEVK